MRAQAFDPWKATLAEAQEAERATGFATGPESPLLQWDAVQAIARLRAPAEQGDGFAVLDAIARCARRGLKVPHWLAVLFLDRYDKVLQCHIRSWDEAFGRPYSKGTNIAYSHRARLGLFSAALAFSDILTTDPSRSVGKELWAEVGQRIGEGATRAEELYREALRIGWAPTVTEIRARLRVTPAKKQKLAGVRRKR